MLFGTLRSLRVIGTDLRPFFKQFLDYIYGRRMANIVGIGFEGQSKCGNFFTPGNPKRLYNFFCEIENLPIVNFLDFMEQGKAISQIL